MQAFRINVVVILTAGLAFCASIFGASAAAWKHERDQDRWPGNYERYGRAFARADRKIKIRAADDCLIERKWKKSGHTEKLKCKPVRRLFRH